VDPVHRSTVDRVKGYALILIRAVGLDRTAVAACRRRAAAARQRRRRRAAAAAAGSPEEAIRGSRAPFAAGKAPGRRGGGGEAHPGAGGEGTAAEEEIGGEGRSSGGLFVAAMLRGRVGAEERCEVLGSSGSPFIGPRGEGEGAAEAVGVRSMAGGQ
jgi:hypothetical protein